MELLSYYFLTFAFLLAIVLSFLKTKAFPPKPSDSDSLRLPPGPWQLPIVGSLHHLIIGGALPHRALRDMSKKYGPLMLLQLGETPTVIASSVEAAKEIMKTQDVTFATRPISITVHTLSWQGKDIIFAPYGDYWRQTRKVCITKLFGPKRIQVYRSLREEEVKNLIRNIAAAAKTSPLVNLSELMTNFVSDTTVRAITGATHKEHPEFMRAWGISLGLAAGSNMADLFPSRRSLTDILSGATYEAKRCNDIIGGLFDNIIKMKRERNAISDATDTEDEDLLDVLLKMHQGEGVPTPLELDSIKGVLLDLFGAGGETSATTLDWAISELVRHPSTLERAIGEVRSVLKGKPTVADEDVDKLPYIQNVIRETLRLHTPVPLLPRLSQADCTVLGYDIPKNTKFLVNGWALGRDPKYWDNPDSFKPERFKVHAVDYKGTELEYIPFGAGRRQCPGTMFGIANVELCLANLLYHFDWELPQGVKPDKLDMAELFGVTIRRKNHLFLRPVLRIPCPTT
ncbi:desmethyl-deoxy-podophyllotoxin synthase-like [Carex rostrata]